MTMWIEDRGLRIEAADAQCREAGAETSCSRRGFLAATGVTTTTMLLGQLFPGRVVGQDPDTPVELAQLPRQIIGQLANLAVNEPIPFSYPIDGPRTACFLIKLGLRAGGGVGPDEDIVAFSSVCTHMGGSLADGFRPEYAACVCPSHLSSFDLNRHGMVIAGHATAPLPQIVLELDGVDIVAVGIAGLLYGCDRNPSGTEA